MGNRIVRISGRQLQGIILESVERALRGGSDVAYGGYDVPRQFGRTMDRLADAGRFSDSVRVRIRHLADGGGWNYEYSWSPEEAMGYLGRLYSGEDGDGVLVGVYSDRDQDGTVFVSVTVGSQEDRDRVDGCNRQYARRG